MAERQRRSVWPPIAWMALIFATSSTVITRSTFVPAMQVLAPTKATSDGFPSFWKGTWFIFVKGWHFTEYLILTYLLWRVLRKPWLAWLLAVGFAATDEFHQTFVPERGGLVSDVLIDAAGATVAVLAVTFMHRAKQRSAR